MISFNGTPVTFDEYPNGETLLDGGPFAFDMGMNLSHDVTLVYESDQDLIHLMLLKRHLEARPVDLHIRYMPYSRMDRAEGFSVFTLKSVAQMINWLHFRSVVVDEPHSDVTMALLDRATARYPTIDLLPQVVKQIGWAKDYDYLFFPDAGAQKRYANVLGYKTAVGFKHRDFATGKLSGEMDAVGFKPQATPTKVLILDDLCSYGGTFVMAAEKLRGLGAAEVYLFVTHCELSMWGGKLLDHVDGLYCTDSILHPKQVEFGLVDSSKVHIYSEGKWL